MSVTTLVHLYTGETVYLVGEPDDCAATLRCVARDRNG